MSHHVTIYGALWATSKENNVINLVNDTVSQNILPGVVRIFCVVKPTFRRYHQTMSLLRSDSVRCTSISLYRRFSWEGNANSNGARSSEYGACCILPYLFLSSTPLSPSAKFLCHLYTKLCYTHVVPLYMNLNVSTSIIFADTQNLMALRMSFDGVTSLIFFISYHNLCAISDISNII